MRSDSFSLLADVLVQDALHGAVGDELLQRAVDGLQQGGVVLGDGGGVILHGVFGVQDGEAGALVGGHQSLGGLVIQDDAVHLAVLQGLHGVRGLSEGLDLAQARVLDVPGGIQEAGGAGLGADHVAGAVGEEVVHAGDLAALLDNDHLHAGGVAVREVHLLQTLVGDGHAGKTQVILAGLDAGDDGVKGDVGDLELQAQLVGDGLGDLHVDAHNGVTIVVLIGREGGLGGHGEDAVHSGGEASLAGGGGIGAGGGGAAGGGGVVAAAGGQAQRQGQSQDQSNELLHIQYFLLFQICRVGGGYPVSIRKGHSRRTSARIALPCGNVNDISLKFA